MLASALGINPPCKLLFFSSLTVPLKAGDNLLEPRPHLEDMLWDELIPVEAGHSELVTVSWAQWLSHTAWRKVWARACCCLLPGSPCGT